MTPASSISLSGWIISNALLSIENGGLCFGTLTFTCSGPVPVLPTTTDPVTGASPMVWKLRLRGDTVICPGPGVAVAVAVAVGVAVAVAVGLAVAVAVGVAVDVAVAVGVAVLVTVAVPVAVAV